MVTSGTTESNGTGRYAEVNGINLYYETHGSGRPLILLHGGLGSGEMFGPILPALSERHQVITVDLQGHGRTADIDRPIDIRLMADDIAALIDHLGLEKPDLVGYSLGGGVAFFTAVKHPQKVGKLVMAAANIRRDAIPPEMLAQQAQVRSAARVSPLRGAGGRDGLDGRTRGRGSPRGPGVPRSPGGQVTVRKSGRPASGAAARCGEAAAPREWTRP